MPRGEKAADKKHPAKLLIEAFNAKNSGVKVNGQTPCGDYYETLEKTQAQIASGKPPALVTTVISVNDEVFGAINVMTDRGLFDKSSNIVNYL